MYRRGRLLFLILVLLILAGCSQKLSCEAYDGDGNCLVDPDHDGYWSVLTIDEEGNTHLDTVVNVKAMDETRSNLTRVGTHDPSACHYHPPTSKEVGDWAFAVNQAHDGELTQAEVEAELLGIMEASEVSADCFASIDIGLLGKTYDEFAHEEYGMPEDVSLADVYVVKEIGRQASRREVTREEATQAISYRMSSKTTQSIAWLMRRMPIYDSDSAKLVPLDLYMHEQNWNEESGTGTNSRIAQDPVGTSVDLMFGEWTPEDLRSWMGFDD